MSAPVTVANSARSGGLLQRMPFGRFKGLPFAQVPEDYAAWLLKRDIDDRLRAALEGSNGSGQTASAANGAAQPAQAGDINRVVSEFLQARRGGRCQATRRGGARAANPVARAEQRLLDRPGERSARRD